MTIKRNESNIKAVAFDLDGVIYLGDFMLPLADVVIQKLTEREIHIFFITNNSTRTRQDISNKINSFGIKTSFENIYSSAYLAGRFIHENYPENSRSVHVIGSEGLKNELLNAGIPISNNDFDTTDILLVGYDAAFTYQTIVDGFNLVFNGSKFLACNLEAKYPIEGNQWMPGSASMVASIEASSGKKPDNIIGKPNTYMLEMIAKEHGLEPEQILVIGDTPESDIIMANKFGSPSVLFKSGTESSIRSPIDSCVYQPTYIVNNHIELISLLLNNDVINQ